MLPVHPFVRYIVVAREPMVIAVARRFHLDRGRQCNPIEGAVAGCGIGGRAVERFPCWPRRVLVGHSRWLFWLLALHLVVQSVGYKTLYVRLEAINID